MIPIWPWSKFHKLKKEIEAADAHAKSLEETIDGLNTLSQNQHEEKQRLKKHILDAAKILEEKEKDFKNTIAFLELQNMSK